MTRFGAVLVAIVFASALLPVAPARFAAAQSPNDSAFGVNSHIASRYPDPSRLDEPAEVLGQAHTGWVREDFQFARINPSRPDAFEWLFTDNAVNELTKRGIQIIGVLNGPTPGWAAQGRGDRTFAPPDPQAFARFARAVVARYADRINHWEVWNEPDNPFYWQPAPNPAAYARLLSTAAPAIRAANPQAQILSAGLVTPYPALTFLADVARYGAWNAFDIVSIHPYTDPQGPEAGQIDTFGVQAVQALVQKLGAKPLWATEFGWSTGAGGRGNSRFDEETQANYLVRAALLLRAAGVERILLYNLKDDPGEKYGLLRYGASKTDYSSFKPSYAAFRTLNQQLGDSVSVAPLALSQWQPVEGFEPFGVWQRGNQRNGTLAETADQVHSGSTAAQLSYNFPTARNDYVIFSAKNPALLPDGTTRIGIWVYGDGSVHALKVWLRDATGEVLQFRLGPVGTAGWHLVSAAVTDAVPSYDRVSGARNGRLDLPARLQAIVLDDEPDAATGSGTIYLDDVVALSGPPAYGVRFGRADGSVVDALWSLTPTTVTLRTVAPDATLTDRSGNAQTISASDGLLTVEIGPSPVYVAHTPTSS